MSVNLGTKLAALGFTRTFTENVSDALDELARLRLPAPDVRAADPKGNDFTMYTAHCPFRKDGTPVLGNMGANVQHVVVMTSDDFKRLLNLIPADVLAGQKFGHYSMEG